MNTALSRLLRHDIALYVHYPFCVHKCPYCDFASESFGADAARDESYIDCLLSEFRLKIPYLQGRKFVSIYIGGGTPSLAPAACWGRLLKEVLPYCCDDVEISLEANPGTVDYDKLAALHEVGFNRISIGVQSFDNASLKRLGRIHDRDEAHRACVDAQRAGFHNFNIDIMHGLPRQTPEMALADLREAVDLGCTHLSWYELTLEEDTVFGKHPPQLPDEDTLLEIETQGFALLKEAGFEHYEVSGYCREGQHRCVHNQNYWRYGDYMGIGAAAHQKLTFLSEEVQKLHPQLRFDELCFQPERLQELWQEQQRALWRIERSANPESYQEYRTALQCTLRELPRWKAWGEEKDAVQGLSHQVVPAADIPFEFMLNRLRLWEDDVHSMEYLLHTGRSIEALRSQLEHLAELKLLDLQKDLSFTLSNAGKLMLNDAICEFL